VAGRGVEQRGIPLETDALSLHHNSSWHAVTKIGYTVGLISLTPFFSLTGTPQQFLTTDSESPERELSNGI